MSKFHINKHGVPAPCRATKGRCPLGGEGEHFESKEEAQRYQDGKNEAEFGLVPEITSEEKIKAERVKSRKRDRLTNLLNDNGFHYYNKEDLVDNSELELTLKASGDGYESYTKEVFGKDYAEVEKLAKDLNVEIPDTVWND